MQTNIYFGNNTFSHLEALKNLNTDVKYSECLKFKQKPVRISGRSDFRHLGFLGHTQNVQISACSDIRQCLKSERSNMYHWLLNGLQQAFLVLL